MEQLKYLVVGLLFGITLVKAQVMSWFRIQEMFHFHSFHMYGVIGTAVMVGALSVWLIKKSKIKTIEGEKITFEDKIFSKGQIIGGLTFGIGWAITGACPGPMYALVGSGAMVVAVMIFSAIFGTWVYGFLKDRLPS